MTLGTPHARGRLGDVITLQRGFDLPESQRKDGDIPVIASTGIIGFHCEKRVDGPGVVIGRSGSIGGGQYIADDFWPLNTTLWVKDFKGHHPRFVYYLLRSIDFTPFNAGAGVPTLNRNHLDSLAVPLFRDEQERRISDILSIYDDLIENNGRRMALLEEAARQLYREWFVRLRFPGHEHTRITNGVPEGWEDCRVSDFGLVVTGKTPSTKEADNYGGDIPFIKTPDMHGNVFVVKTEASLTEKGANTQPGKFIPPITLLVSCIGTIGVVSMTSARAQFNQQINAVVSFEDTYGYYLFFALRNLKEAMEAIGGGATMGNVNKTKFEGIEILKPAMSLLREFQEFCAPLFQQIRVLSVQNLRLRSARDLLLPRLMSGDIAV